MRSKFLFQTGAIILALLLGWSGVSVAAPLDDLVAAAKKEGVVEFYGPSTLTPQGAAAIGKAFNKKYGMDIGFNYSPSGSMTRDVGKIIGHAASGVAPQWDVMLVTDAHHGSLWLRKLLEPYDFKGAGVDPNLIHYDSSAISFANQVCLPAYNTKNMPANDVPKKWDDLLDPKWKGKMGIIHSTHHWARLAAGPWGEEKTTAFVKKLAQQDPILGRPSEMYTRLQLGEVMLVSTLQNSMIHQAVQKGAPLAQAEMDPVISPAYHAAVPKGAKHASAGHLVAVFMTTPEGQELWEKYTGHTSAFVPGTTVYKYAQGREMVYMNQKQAKQVDKLARTYGKILGFRK